MEELNKALSNAMADLNEEGSKAVVDTLEFLVKRSEEAVNKAKENAREGETDLQKTLNSEAGEGGEPENEAPETFIDKIMKLQDSEKGV